jgi:polysaccharide pyruvyl transferase WcaK-like protein
MKILVENGAYHLKNMGDVSMLQVAVSRLEREFPHASIYVMTTCPEDLPKFCPKAIPVTSKSRNYWLTPIADRLYNNRRRYVSTSWRRLERFILLNIPALRNIVLSKKLENQKDALIDFKAYYQLFSEIDLVVMTGGGYVTDVFMGETVRKLEILSIAKAMGKTTIAFGQGLGPVEDKYFFSRVKLLASSIDLLALRESRAGIDLIKKMNIPLNKVSITGDDAIELAYNARKNSIGSSIGISLRMAPYSGIDEIFIDSLKREIRKFSYSKNADLLPIPIQQSTNKNSISDCDSIARIINDVSINEQCRALDTPFKVINQAGLCRLVIAGSYHAAVFSLSQGIPCICIAKSQYYADKFLGLANQFGSGCEVLFLSDEDFINKLVNKLDYLWENAFLMRENLLKAALIQIEAGKQFYKKSGEVCKANMGIY